MWCRSRAEMQAVYNGSGLQYYRHADWLGSNRFSATPSGTVYFDQAYAPFGENYAEMGTTDRSFTGDTQDIVAGLYDFTFRQQSSAQGRWLVPDPAGLAAVDITNPQTWNRYAYVNNNPLSNIDPQGLFLEPCWNPDQSCSWSLGGPAGVVEDLGGGEGDGGGNSDGSGSGSGDASNGSGSTSSGSGSGCDDWVCHFFAGSFSGTWTQTQQNDWISQQFWQTAKGSDGTPLWNFLPQNQNPKAQATIWESQWANSGVAFNINGKIVPFPSLAPQQNPFSGPASIPKGSACTKSYLKEIKQCGSYPPGPEQQACVQRAQSVLNNCISRAF